MTPFRQQVYYMTYLEEEYGRHLEQAMIADLMHTDAGGRQYASRVLSQYLVNGLDQDSNPKFYEQYKDLGGNPEYLSYATTCFKNVVKKLRTGNI